MAYPQNHTPSPPNVASEISYGGANSVSGFQGQKIRFPNPPDAVNPGFQGQNIRFPNPPDAVNPDPATLREQWRFAARQYGRWYSQAWGGAILAGVSFFALGWVIKGGNPLPSLQGDSRAPPYSDDPKEVPD